MVLTSVTSHSNLLRQKTLQGILTYLKLQQKEFIMNDRADFRKYYRNAHATALLTDREKKLIGIAVAIVRNCQP